MIISTGSLRIGSCSQTEVRFRMVIGYRYQGGNVSPRTRTGNVIDQILRLKPHLKCTNLLAVSVIGFTTDMLWCVRRNTLQLPTTAVGDCCLFVLHYIYLMASFSSHSCPVDPFPAWLFLFEFKYYQTRYQFLQVM